MSVGAEDDRRSALLAAEASAMRLFAAIQSEGLITPGRSETDVQNDIYELARGRFGVEKHWHKRIVRAGANTLTIAGDNPPIRTLMTDDTVYVDLGPVFEEWEADVGRTYVLGENESKRRLVRDLERVFIVVRDHYRQTPGITGAQLYEAAQKAASAAGWMFGGKIAGHIVSEFAHAYIPGDKELNRIGPGNPAPMNDRDALGRIRHWILEIHLVDPGRTFGGFYERLL